jgi:hypothetical protein
MAIWGVIMAKEYLYIFGYEDPSERQANSERGTDYESSEAIRIIAENQAEALDWGKEISESFIQYLFGNDQISWKNERFAAWIEINPDHYLRDHWETLPRVNVGEYPDFQALVKQAENF